MLVLVVVHWPLVMFGGPAIARVLARKQHIDVSFELSGTLWTNLSVTGLRATPTGDGPTPVELIRIDKLQFDYSIFRLISRGIGEFLSSYEVHRADLQFVALPSATHEEKEEKKSIIETLRTVLAQPAAYSDRVLIDDFSIKVRSPEAETAIRQLSLLFDTKKEGYVKIGRVQVPRLPVWENLTSETSYVNRNLYQRNLRLSPDLVIDEINFDASHRAEGRGQIAIRTHVFGGEFSLVLTGQEKNEKGDHLAKAYDTHLQIAVSGVRVHDAAAYFGVKDVPVEKLSAFELDFRGDPEKPRTWNGSMRTAVQNLGAGALIIPEIELKSQFADGTATTGAGVRIGANSVDLNSRIALPERIDNWLAAGVDATATIAGRDLPALVSKLSPGQSVNGTVGLDATIAYHDRRAVVGAKYNVRDLAMNQITVPLIAGDMGVNAVINPSGRLQTDDLDAKLGLNIGALKVGTFAVDGAEVQLDVSKGFAVLRKLAVNRGTNSVTATARVQLPPDPAQIAQSAGEVEFAIHAPALAEFGLSASDKPIRGNLETQARIKFANGKGEGDVQLGGLVGIEKFETKELSGAVHLRGDQVQLEQFTIGLSDLDRLVVRGKFGTTAPQPYEASLQLGIRDLAILQPLLSAFGVAETVKGALDVSWKGQGALTPAKHEGEASVTVKDAAYGKTVLNSLQLSGAYTESSAKGQLSVAMGPTRLQTGLAWENNEVALQKLTVHQGEQQALSGDISYSLAKTGEAPLDPMKQPFKVRIEADKLDLEKLFASLKQEAAASGRISMRLAAQGTPSQPEVEFALNGQGLKAKAAAQFDPAEVDVALNYHPGALSLDASARQPLIKPMVIKARVPLDVEKVLADKKLDPSLPLNVEVTLPPSSLGVLPKLSPQVRRIDGTVALDLKVGGTVEHPAIGGEATVALKNARLANESVPAIGLFDAHLVFRENALNFDRFKGEIGGGTFALGGKVGVADLKNPTFDLQLKADKVLVKRDDSITVRTDTDLKVGGALNAGTVSGTVYVTQSRFFKEIDILPIGLPGKPKPAPKSAPAEMNISLPAPLDTWKFDIGIKTRENDPFLVRGNLANGRVALNLQLGGEGKQPFMEGTVTIEQFTGSLPFSQISVENGHVYFTRESHFMPTLDIQSVSKIREYTVTAYIFGNALEPQLQLSSEPPLPHADIVSLIATGTTTGELSGNADMLASRAAIYAIESLWKKIFKKKTPPKEEAPRNDTSFVDRFTMDFGGVDQKTGAREANVRFKVNDQTYILGELDTQGRYTGSLKYLLRFR